MYWPHVTMFMAAVACVANLSLLRLPKPAHYNPLRAAYLAWHTMVGVTAGFYAAAFAVLILTDVDRGDWSATLTPISSVVFLTVWTVPALLYRTAYRRPKR